MHELQCNLCFVPLLRSTTMWEGKPKISGSLTQKNTLNASCRKYVETTMFLRHVRRKHLSNATSGGFEEVSTADCSVGDLIDARIPPSKIIRIFDFNLRREAIHISSK